MDKDRHTDCKMGSFRAERHEDHINKQQQQWMTGMHFVSYSACCAVEREIPQTSDMLEAHLIAMV